MDFSGFGALGIYLLLAFVLPGFCYVLVFALCFPREFERCAVWAQQKQLSPLSSLIALGTIGGLLLTSACFALEILLRGTSSRLLEPLFGHDVVGWIFPSMPLAQIAIIEAAGKASFYAQMLSGQAIMHFSIGVGVVLIPGTFALQRRWRMPPSRRWIPSVLTVIAFGNLVVAHEVFGRANEGITQAVKSAAQSGNAAIASAAQGASPDCLLLPNLDLLKQRLIAYHDCACDCGCYADDVRRVGGQALAFLKDYLDAHPKDNEGDRKPAVVFDIDETALSNWENLKRTDFGYSHDEFVGWEKQAKATAIVPTLQLFEFARDHNVATFFITGRAECEREFTIKDLTAAGYKGWTGLIMNRADSPHATSDYKSGERKKLVGEGYLIIVNIGDQESDLIGEPAQRNFKLPDPFYLVQ
jgi:hypothetical protein